MSTKASIKVCESCSCKEIKFSETTGIYNNPGNLTGYGSPNETLGNANSAMLTITRGDGQVFTIDLFALGIFPTNNVDFVYIIPNESIGYTTGQVIPDQLMIFKYVVGFVDGSFISTNKYEGFTCNTKCCVFSMLKDIDWTCECSAHKLDKFLQAWGLYQGLLSAKECGEPIEFTNILNQLNKICKNSNCGCGC